MSIFNDFYFFPTIFYLGFFVYRFYKYWRKSTMSEIPSVVLPDEDVRIICHHEEWDCVYPELLKELKKFSVSL